MLQRERLSDPDKEAEYYRHSTCQTSPNSAYLLKYLSNCNFIRDSLPANRYCSQSDRLLAALPSEANQPFYLIFSSVFSSQGNKSSLMIRCTIATGA